MSGKILASALMLMPAVAHGQSLKIEGSPADPKVIVVNRLLQAPSNLADLVVKGATIHTSGPRPDRLTLATLRTALKGCTPLAAAENLEIAADHLSVRIACPVMEGDPTGYPYVVEFNFDGQKVRSINFALIVTTAPEGTSS